MNIGNMRHRVTIEKIVKKTDPYGDPYDDWGEHATVWAAIEPLTGREYWGAQQVDSEVAGKIRIRYLSDINPTMRVKFGTRIYEILAVINVNERNEELTLMVREKLT